MAHTLGKVNMTLDTRPKDQIWKDGFEKDRLADTNALTNRQKQLLYECEEERLVIKACLREVVKLKRHFYMIINFYCDKFNFKKNNKKCLKFLMK